MNWILPKFETSRLILRPITLKDAEVIYSYSKLSEVSRYTLWDQHLSLEDTNSFINDYALSNYEKGVPEPFALELKDTGEMIGTAGAFWISEQNRCMEMGYVLNPKYWGQGFIVEACEKVIDYCFHLYGLERMQIRCKKENAGSLRVMEKLGFHFEGTLRSQVFSKGRFWDMHYTSLTREEWNQKQKCPYVRRATYGDEEGWHQAHMKSIQTLCAKDYTSEQIQAWGGRPYNFEMKRKLIDKDYVWVVQGKDKIEGYALLTHHKEKAIGEVGGLYLTPEVVGKGLGKQLCFLMEEMAKVVGCKEMFLSSTKTSKKFYESCGYQQFREDDSCMIGGVPIEGHPMRKLFVEQQISQ